MISRFVKNLQKKPSENLFNPWFDIDPEHDISSDSPVIRKKQFEAYLNERRERARYLFVAEALGYQGGHFTGIAMTSERILLGHQYDKYGVKPEHVFNGLNPARTSKRSVTHRGMSEPTATIMWGALIELGIDPFEVVLWNAVPWHPYKPEKGLVSNRTPTRQELNAGLIHLQEFLRLFPGTKIVAVGRKCEESLSEIGVSYTGVRHPANGGAGKFRRQLKELAG
ncbi:MAG: uracil-DNA glycosylase [Balneolaceae bacterium]